MKLTTKEVVSVYNVLKEAKLTKMEISDKMLVLKIMRILKPIAEEWESFMQTIDDKVKGENHDEIIEKAREWERDKEKTTLSDSEKREINEYLIQFSKDKNTCFSDELNKELELDITKISSSAYEKLVESNDFEVDKLLTCEIIVNS